MVQLLRSSQAVFVVQTVAVQLPEQQIPPEQAVLSDRGLYWQAFEVSLQLSDVHWLLSLQSTGRAV
jgi:hypothetical protein